MSKEKETTAYQEQMKNTCVNVLKSLGYEVELKEKPKMPAPFLKKGDSFYYVLDYPIQILYGTVISAMWAAEASSDTPIMEVTFFVDVGGGRVIEQTFYIEENEMEKFYFSKFGGALKRAEKILCGNGGE